MAEYIYTEQQGSYVMTDEQIVRCKDCRYYREHEWIIATDVDDVCLFFGSGVKVEPDGFCKWGERKEAE